MKRGKPGRRGGPAPGNRPPGDNPRPQPDTGPQPPRDDPVISQYLPPSLRDQLWDDVPVPAPGESIPPDGSGLSFRAPGEIQREARGNPQAQWFEANGLGGAPESRAAAHQNRRQAEQIERLEQRLAQAATQFAALASERDTLAAQVTHYEEAARYQAALAQEHKITADRERGTTETLRAEAQEKDTVIGQHESAIRELRAKLGRKDSEITRQRAQTEETEAGSERHRAAADRLQVTLAERDSEAERLRSTITKLRAEAERKDSAIARLESELDQRVTHPLDEGPDYEDSFAGYEERMLERQQARIRDLESTVNHLIQNGSSSPPQSPMSPPAEDGAQ